jgi:hypothetical protein
MRRRHARFGLSAVALVGLVASGCEQLTGSGTAKLTHAGDQPGAAVASVESASGVTSATYSAKSRVTQVLTVPESSPVKGTALSFPPGALAIDTGISIQESVSLASAGTGAELGIGNAFAASSPAVVIRPDVATDPVKPFSLAIAMPKASGLALDGQLTLVIIYKVFVVATGETLVGIIPPDQLTVDGGLVNFDARYFGAYQAAFVTIEIKAPVEKPSETPILAKAEAQALPALSITGRKPLVIGSGTRVELTGANFRPTMVLALAGRSVGVDVASDSSASFIAPDGLQPGLLALTADQDGVSQNVSLVYQTGDLPIIGEAETEVCAGKKYYGLDGTVRTGTKSCSGPDLRLLKAENIRQGVTVAGVTGTLAAVQPVPLCSATSLVDCRTSPAFPAVVLATVRAQDIRTGASIAGVAGSVVPEAHQPCAVDGAQGCVTVPPFQAVNMASIAPGDIRAGRKIGTVVGSIPPPPPLCLGNGQSGCALSGPFVSINPSTIPAASIRAGSSIAGVVGTLAEAPAACAGNGQSGCVATPPYLAFNPGSLSPADVRAGVDVAGVMGTLVETFPCTWEGETNCSVHGTFVPISSWKIAPSNIRDGFDMAGTLGNVVPAQPDCAWDGQMACTANGNFRAADLSNVSPSDIRTGKSIAGIMGSAVVPPLCNMDGQQNCVTVWDFPAVDRALLGNGNIRNGVMVAGVWGNYPSMSFPLNGFGGGGVYTDLHAGNFDDMMRTASSFQYWDSAGNRFVGYGNADIQPANFASGHNFFGMWGALPPPPPGCSWDGDQNCVTNYAFPAADRTLLENGNIRNGVRVGGVWGNYPSGMYPMADANMGGVYTDLEPGSFAARLKSDAEFQYWDSMGMRHIGTGDSDINPNNIRAGHEVFGTFGSLVESGGPAPNPWDIRFGINVNGVVGKLKMRCNNAIASTLFNYDGGVDTLPMAGIVNGSILNTWDTVTDQAFPPHAPAFMDGTDPNESNCMNADVDPNGDAVWLDVTPGSCGGNPSSCVLTDKITRLSYGAATTDRDWLNANWWCDSLMWNGVYDWRLATQKELQQAYVHGIRPYSGSALLPGDGYYWTATTTVYDTNKAVLLDPVTGESTSGLKTQLAHVLCVRN